jgi:hypothetical protein
MMALVPADTPAPTPNPACTADPDETICFTPGTGRSLTAEEYRHKAIRVLALSWEKSTFAHIYQERTRVSECLFGHPHATLDDIARHQC